MIHGRPACPFFVYLNAYLPVIGTFAMLFSEMYRSKAEISMVLTLLID